MALIGTRQKYFERARLKFIESDEAILNGLDELLAEHAAKGLLKSGGTIKKAVATYEAVTLSTLDDLLAEVGKNIHARGWEWRSAIRGVRDAALEQHGGALLILKRKPPISGLLGEDRVANATHEMLTNVGSKIVSRVSDFEEGWSAPVSPKWTERHPLGFALIVAVVSFALGLIADPVREWLFIR